MEDFYLTCLILAPLYVLHPMEVDFQSPTEQEAFKHSKELLLSSMMVVYFNAELLILLACDASE